MTTGPVYPVKATIVNVAEVEPEVIPTEAGTVKCVMPVVSRVTVSPPAGAGPTSVTVQVPIVPTIRCVGLQLNELAGTIPTDSVNVCGSPFRVAVTVIRA
jgi:hypothetical protein